MESSLPAATWRAALMKLAAVVLCALEPGGWPIGGRRVEGAEIDFRSVLTEACLSCHDGVSGSGGFSVADIPRDLADSVIRDRLALAYDRVVAGEMPPEEVDFADGQRQALLQTLGAAVREADLADMSRNGRVPLRRLNRREFEHTLQDLLGMPDLDIADRMPEDGVRDGFNKSAEGLDMSRIQLEAMLDSIDAALVAAVAPAEQGIVPRTFTAISTRLFGGVAYGEPEAMYFAKHSLPVASPAADDPDVECALFRSAYWPYHGYPAGFVAGPAGSPGAVGRYRIRFRARAVLQQADRSLLPATAPVAMTFRARAPSGPDVSGDVRAVGGLFDIAAEEAQYEGIVLLREGQTLEYSLLGLAVPLARNENGGPPTYRFPPPPPGGHRGIAFRAVEITGPLPPESWPPPSHRLLFGDLPIRAAAGGQFGPVEVLSADPPADVWRLLTLFAERAFTHAPSAEEIEAAGAVVLDALEEVGFAAAMLRGFQTLLASPRILFVSDPRGSDQAALAARLSYFLWDTRPDARLLELARGGDLNRPEVLRAETDRLIDDPRFARFITNFTDHWLDLGRLRRDEPDARLFPEYRFDDYLVESLGMESRESVARLIRDNQQVGGLVDSEVLLVNDRLAEHYGLEPVAGSALRAVPRPAGSPYGGLLTQGAVLKVTSNGTTTSPVKRGAWVMSRLIGQRPPPPPEKVPAVEPDIRGATSIRDLLARHTADPACGKCHRRFDPVGFALEAFDVVGGRRDRYRGLGLGEPVTGIDRAGHDFQYALGPSIDTAGTLADGTPFEDIRGLKRLLGGGQRQMARNLLCMWTAYATGGALRFSDRPHVEAILDANQPDGFRVRGLLHAFVTSPMFTGAITTTDGGSPP